MNSEDNRCVIPQSSSEPRHPGLEQLIVIALADSQFATALLADPAAALESTSHPVSLSPLEKKMVVSIQHAADIHDFAAQLYNKIYPSK
jgi:hypothetical protein